MGIEKDKIQAVYKYLQNEFPECKIKDRNDTDIAGDYVAQTFRIIYGKFIHEITIDEAFFEDHRTEEISAWLEDKEPARHVSKKANSHVIVNMDGTIEVCKLK